MCRVINLEGKKEAQETKLELKHLVETQYFQYTEK